MKKRAIGPRIVFMKVECPPDKAEVSTVELLDEDGVGHVFRDGRQTTLKRLMKVLDGYDILVTWGGAERDVPILTAWSLHVGADPSPLHNLMHLDLQLFIKQHLKINGPELEKTARFLGARPKTDHLKTLEAVFDKLRKLIKTIKPELAL
ncbi:MAG: hypothetical protein QW419_00390 [Candidatus Caldarchaeum sp.]